MPSRPGGGGCGKPVPEGGTGGPKLVGGFQSEGGFHPGGGGLNPGGGGPGGSPIGGFHPGGIVAELENYLGGCQLAGGFQPGGGSGKFEGTFGM